jgi:hypothetical protein
VATSDQGATSGRGFVEDLAGLLRSALASRIAHLFGRCIIRILRTIVLIFLRFLSRITDRPWAKRKAPLGGKGEQRMRRLPVSLGIVVFMVAAVPALAQNPLGNNGRVVATIKAPATINTRAADTRLASATSTKATPAPAPASEQTMTPEMWYYQQYQQQLHNPAEMVYQRADARANQRMQRLASLKWFGYSNSRPQAGADLTGGDQQGPGWVSNNSTYPYRFSGYGTADVFILR